MTDKDELYKNLEFASKAYYAAEGVFPLWEAAFALIEGQILIAYLSTRYQKVWVAVLGLIISLIWFILVSLNYLNAAHITREMHKIHDCIKTHTSSMPPIWPWPNGNDKTKWTWAVIITGKLPKQQGEENGSLLKSTWFYRRVLPAVMIIVWLVPVSLAVLKMRTGMMLIEWTEPIVVVTTLQVIIAVILGVITVRQYKERNRERKKAYLVAHAKKLTDTNYVIEIHNQGNGPATKVKTLIGKTPVSTRTDVINPRDISDIAAKDWITYKLRGNPDTEIDVSITWTDDTGEPGKYENQLICEPMRSNINHFSLT